MSLRVSPNRRDFLTATGLVVGAGLTGTRSALAFQSANERPTFATIGLRNQGWHITSKSFKFADFVALADVDANVLAENVDKVQKNTGKKPDAYKDYREVLARQDIDAVMIATPTIGTPKSLLKRCTQAKTFIAKSRSL